MEELIFDGGKGAEVGVERSSKNKIVAEIHT
jgi:hypothetical protein